VVAAIGFASAITGNSATATGATQNLSDLHSGAMASAKRASRHDTRLLPGFVVVSRGWPLRFAPAL